MADTRHRGSLIVLRGHLILVYLFLYVPIVVLIILSFNESGLPTVWTGTSFKWYGALVENETIQRAATNTILVALSSTLIATVLGTLLALGIEMRQKQNSLLDALLFAPMIIPDIVLAIALLSLFSLLEFTLGLHSIVISHVVFNIAFVFAVVRTRLRNFDFSVIEASIDLGGSAFTTFWRITFPSIAPGVLAGALLALTLSIDEFIITFFVSGANPSSQTLPMQIYSMIRFGVTPEINALATLVMLFSFVALFVSQRLNKGVLIS